MSEIKLTTKEKKAIAELKNALRSWPDTLWLLASGDYLYVMRYTPDGKKSAHEESKRWPEGGFDEAYIVCAIDADIVDETWNYL